MISVIQYRFIGEESQFAPVRTYDQNADVTFIPSIGSVVELFPAAPTGYGRVIAIEDKLMTDPKDSAEKRFITLTLERV